MTIYAAGRNLPKPRGVSMPTLQYNIFIHDVDKLSYVLREGPPQCTCHFNSQLPVVGSSTLHLSLQLSTVNGVGSSTFQSSESHIIWDWLGGILHISIQSKSHNTGGGVGGSYPPHFTSSQSHIVWDGRYTPHLTNQVECASAVKPN